MGATKWTDEAIRAEAAKYLMRSDWVKFSNSSYVIARKRSIEFFESCCAHMVKKIRTHSDADLLAMALKYKSKMEWRDADKSAYDTAAKRDIFAACCSHMPKWAKKESKWNLESIKAQSNRFKTKSEWQKCHYASYVAAQKMGLIDLCSAHTVPAPRSDRIWTREALLKDALKYPNKVEWAKNNKAAIKAARQYGHYQECVSHMVALKRPNGHWNYDTAKSSAAAFNSRKEWETNCSGAYCWAQEKGLIDELCTHMEFKPPSENNVIYIWKAERELFNGESVYKIGMTSARLGKRRIKKVEKDSKFKATVIALVQVSGRATLVERKLLALGQDPKYMAFDGSTEFRALSDEQLQQALDILNQHAVEELAIAA